jgi:hypothetical protein
LLEAPLAQIFSCLLGLDEIPGILTLIGGLVISVGLYFTIKGGVKRKNEEI